MTPAGLWQRWWYAGLDAEARVQAAALDRLITSRASWGLWLAALSALFVVAWGLRNAGSPLGWSVFSAVGFVAGILLAMRLAWLQPERFEARVLRGLALVMVVSFASGVLSTLVLGLWLDVPDRSERLGRALQGLWRSAPALLAAAFVVLILVWIVGVSGRAQMRRALQQSRLEAERDAAARLAAEARLQLLQAQIQPHFLFNTLAALQHWVDSGDVRAAPLLRALTGFLRGSTELMARDEATLADELPLARHYLDIMRSRLGEGRLAVQFDIEPAATAQPLPPGLLLTLLENAVEHGVAPALHAGRIAVSARAAAGRFELAVSDNGAGLAAGWHDGVGLANGRERLRHRFGARAWLALRPPASGSTGTLAQVVIHHEVDATATAHERP